MQTLDWLMIGGYFSLLLGVAWWVVRKSKDTAADYFLAGRNLGWWVIGASIFASNIGSEHVVGLAGSGAKDGVAMAHYELHAWCLLVLAWVFVPFYARSLVFTMPEFLERRFSPGSRYVLSIVSLITFIVSKIAVGIFAGGVVFSHAAARGATCISARLRDQQLLDRLGAGDRADRPVHHAGRHAGRGLQRRRADRRADHRLGHADDLRPVQAGRLARAAAQHLRLGHVQPLEAARSRRASKGPGRRCWTRTRPAIVREAWYFNGNFPWLGMAICAPIIGLWYWCTDQYIVQRALGAPNEQTARRGSIFAAFLKLFPVYLFIIPGLICFALAKSGKVPELADASCPTASRSAARGPGRLPADGRSTCCRPGCGASSWPGCSRR